MHIYLLVINNLSTICYEFLAVCGVTIMEFSYKIYTSGDFLHAQREMIVRSEYRSDNVAVNTGHEQAMKGR